MLIARFALALALAVSGAIHLELADSYAGIGEQITVGMLFRAQGLVALVVAGWVLARREDRAPLVAALLVGVGSFLAVVLSVYVRVPAIGPFPELYEPVWYDRKIWSAVAAGVVGPVAAGLLARSRRRPLP